MARDRGLMVAFSLASIGLGAPLEVWADSDTDALALAERAPATSTSRRNWQTSIEVGVGSDHAAHPVSRLVENTRLSALFAYDGSIAPSWRVVISNRLDANRHANLVGYNAINTLKQAYLTWQPNPKTIIDLGRVNLREGVALGFNPTDFFKAGAVRSIVAIDPESLRENRLGSVVLRSQVLWAEGSLSALVSPKIATERSGATFNPDFGATNHQTRYMLTLSQRLFGTIAPQWLLYGGDGIAPQLGLNLTTLISDATTGYLEYSGGRSLSFTGGLGGSNAFRSRLATGLTHTFANKLSLTIEYDYDGASADRAMWNQLASDSAQYWQYRSAVNRAQELATRQGLFSYTKLQGVLLKSLDLSAMLHVDLVDNSYSNWFEVRYHWPSIDGAIQWVRNRGTLHSTHGSNAKNQVNAVITFFF